MMTLSDRIQYLVDTFADSNKTKFAELVDTSEANVRNYLKGTMPKFEVVSQMLTVFITISPDWFVLGKGKIYRSQNIDTTYLFEESYDTLKPQEKANSSIVNPTIEDIIIENINKTVAQQLQEVRADLEAFKKKVFYKEFDAHETKLRKEENASGSDDTKKVS
jgi:hypothetical protein